MENIFDGFDTALDCESWDWDAKKMREIKLSQGKVALVSDRDYEELAQYKWHAHWDGWNWYAARNAPTVNGKRATIKMHQVLCGEGSDHIDGNGLNNQRENLRPATRSQNMFNRRLNKNSDSGFKGVNRRKDRNKWVAYIKVNGKQQHLGYFDTAEEAGRAYDVAARELHGKFARLNFSKGD